MIRIHSEHYDDSQAMAHTMTVPLEDVVLGANHSESTLGCSGAAFVRIASVLFFGMSMRNLSKTCRALVKAEQDLQVTTIKSITP